MKQRILLEERRRKKRPEHINRDALARFDSGDGTLADVLHLDGTDLQALRERGLAFLSAGNAEKCKAIFEMLDAVGDKNAGVDFVIALCCHKLAREEEARVWFRRGAALARATGAQKLLDDAMRWGSHLMPGAA
jgi:hypothetical protein